MLNAAPIQRAITISTSAGTDATFSDWTTADNQTTATVVSSWNTATDVTNNSGQFADDERYQSPCTSSPNDLDCSASGAGVGRDLRKFAYTWDSTNLYMYVERFESSTSANDWWFYIDSDNSGTMDSGEPILNVKWTGSNGRTTRQLYTYNPASGTGDPLTCPATGTNSVADGYCPVADSGDGYNLPGSVSAGSSLGTVYGGAESSSGVDISGNSLAGIAMETFVSWSALGKTAPASVGFHVASSNGTNLPNQLDDNMDGLSGSGSQIAFSDTQLVKTASSSTVIGGQSFTYQLTLTNNGDSTATNIDVTDTIPANVSYGTDDSASTGTSTTFSSGTLTWTVPSLTSGASVSLVITMSSTVVTTDTLVTNTAQITDQDQADTNSANNSSSVQVTLVAAPQLMILKTAQTLSDPHNGTTNPKAIPGALVDYVIMVSNSGIGTVDDGSMEITDPIPSSAALFVGDLNGAGTGPVTYTDGSDPSGLSYSFVSLDSATDDVDFSNDNGTTWTYYHDGDFSNIANDLDSTITDIRINPKGTMNGANSDTPSFQVGFRVQLE